MDISEVKLKLANALERLETAINNRVNTIMLENSSLKAEVTSLQKELKKMNILYNFKEVNSHSLKEPIMDRSNSKNEPLLVAPSVANDIDISLAKLKKLVS